MIKTITSLFLITSLIGCGQSGGVICCGENQDQLLELYKNKFIEEGRIRGINFNVDIDMFFTSQLDNKTFGLCKTTYFFIFNRTVRQVYISNKINDSILEQVIFHELGHCVFNREHEEEGLMKKNLDNFNYSQNRENWLNDFFKHEVIYVF